MNQKVATRVSDFCGAHRENFPARAPNLARLKNQDEMLQISEDDGLFEFVFPPMDQIVFGEPPSSDKEVPKSEHSKYLWVVTATSLPGALECPAGRPTLKRGTLTHTNLTGGTDAHTGGEMWFRDQETIMINGGSSRYKPRNSKELLSMAVAFRSAGYKVANLGWDDESNIPLRLQTEKVIWL